MRNILVVDGGLRLPDTAENRRDYPGAKRATYDEETGELKPVFDPYLTPPKQQLQARAQGDDRIDRLEQIMLQLAQSQQPKSGIADRAAGLFRMPHLGWARPLWLMAKTHLPRWAAGLVWCVAIANIMWLEMRTLPEFPGMEAPVVGEHLSDLYSALPEWNWKLIAGAAITSCYAVWSYLQYRGPSDGSKA